MFQACLKIMSGWRREWESNPAPLPNSVPAGIFVNLAGKCARREQPARTWNEADMNIDLWRTNYDTIDGFRRFYRDWQPRDEACLPVLALHGSLTQSGMWVAPAEAARSFRMLCPDQRGFGLSDDPGGDSCAEFASDALSLGRALLPERYVVMAHSFACSIALEAAHIAAEHVAAVVLVDPVVRIGPPPATPATASPPPLAAFATLEEAERHFRETEEGEWDGDTLRRFVQDIMMRDSESGTWRFPYTPARLHRLRAFTASPASDYNLLAKARAVRCPVLVFRGGMSKRFPLTAEQPFLQAFATEPKLVVCPRSGHFPTATELNIVVEELKRFLDHVH
jgi:pimeloyl-ACP methyl ester carboxylesterase